MRSRIISGVGLGLCLFLLPSPGFGAQTFSFTYDSWEDRGGNGVINCSELVYFRVSLAGTGALAGGDSGTITVPVFEDHWNYLPGSFTLDPALTESCVHSIVSGNGQFDSALILDYSCDPRAGDPTDGTYALTFRVAGRFFSATSPTLTVEARNERTFPTTEIQDALASPTDPTEACPPPPVPDIRTVKSLASGSGEPGTTLVYDLLVSNVGNGAAAGVQLTDTVPALSTFLPASSSPGWSCTPDNSAGSSCVLAIGTVAAGTSVNRTFAVQLAATFPANPPSINNTACASTSTPGDPIGNDCGSVSTPPGGNPDLRTMKSLTSGNGNPGSTLVYSLMVSNSGNRDAAGVQLTDTVPALATFLPASSSPGWSCSPNNSAGSTCTLAVGTVAAGTSVSATFAVQLAATFPPNPPSIDNTACASTSTGGDPAGNNCGSVSSPPGGNPDLRTTKSVVSGTGDPGSTILYSIVVANIGNRDAAGVQLTDTVPALATFLPGSSSPGWSCSPSNSAGSTCTLTMGTVAAGTSVSATFAVQLAATFPPSPPSIDNTACASSSTGGDPAANNCGSVSTPPGGNPDLQTTKSVASGNGNPGSTLIYNLVVSNLGNRDAAGVQLNETVPVLSTFLPGSSSPGWTCSPSNNAGSTCILSLGTVAAGTSASRTFAVQLAAVYPPDPPAIQNTACSSSSTGGDPAANNCGSTSVPPGGNPDLQMAKSVASGNGNPGGVLVYALGVTNAGNQGAAGVSLQETVPQLTTFLPGSSSPGWTCTPDGNAGSSCTLAVGTVAAGSSVTFTFAVQVASVFPPDPPPIENSACVSTTSGGDPSGNDCGSTSTPPGGNPDLTVTKTVESGDATPGSVLVYQIVVANVGSQGAAGVSLEETVPQLTSFLAASSSPGWVCSPDGNAGSSCTLAVGTVAAGNSVTFTFAVQVANVFPPDPPPIENSACVSTTSGGDPSGNDCDSTSTPPGGNPDVRMVKSVASGSASPGSVLVYSLEVSNGGNQGAAGVSIEETVPQLTSFLAASSSPGWTCSPDGNAGSSCTLAVGTVAAGSSVTFSFAVQVVSVFPPNPPPIENSACVSTTSGGDPGDNDCGSTTTPPGGNPDLRLVKSVASGSASPGSVLVYSLEVSNVGNQGAAGVSIEETVPQLTSFLAASSSPGWTCSPDGNAGSSCTLSVGTVAAGSSVTFAFAVQVANAFPADPPPIENSACVSTTSGGDPEDNDCDSTSTPPGGNPDLRLVKSVASGSANPGGVLVYSLEVSNIGNQGATDVSIEETVPQLTSFLAASSSPGWTCAPDGNAGSSCTLSVGTLAAGSSVTYTFAVQVVDEFPPNPPPIENSACVSTTSGGDPEDNDCDGTSTPPGGSPDLVLSKTLTSGTVVPDGVLVFTLTLDNGGTREATDVVLQETVPASTVFEAASSSPGWTCNGAGAAGTACTLAVGTVAAGASASFTFAVRLPPDLAPDTQVVNTACVEESEETGPDETNCRTVIVDPPGPETATDVEVALGVDEPVRQPGAPFTFTLMVHNASAVPAQGLRISVSLPSFGTEPTELDPACQNPGGAVLECSLAELAGGASASFTWKQPAFHTGDFTISAELMEATPEDVDSVPGNGSRTEDDYAELTVVVSAELEVHDIPTLSTVGFTAMVLLLVALGVVAMRRGAGRSAPGV